MLTSTLRHLLICLLMWLASNAYGDGVPDDCTQLIFGIAPTWNSMRGEVRLFERARGGEWVAVAGPFPVLFGKNGVAWGTGLAGQNESGVRKQERDGRAPAGVFAIGQVFGYDRHLPAGADYQTITRTKKCVRVISRITGWLKSDITPIRRCPAQEARFFFIFAAVSIGQPLAARQWRGKTW